jgi:hypothetical protein
METRRANTIWWVLQIMWKNYTVKIGSLKMSPKKKKNLKFQKEDTLDTRMRTLINIENDPLLDFNTFHSYIILINIKNKQLIFKIKGRKNQEIPTNRGQDYF